MTDTEIIKALECCSKIKYCEEKCLCHSECILTHIPEVLDLINRQKAEIERYKGVIKILEKDVEDARNEGAKNFGRYLIDKAAKGMLSAGDIVDYCYDFTHEVTKIEQAEEGDT